MYCKNRKEAIHVEQEQSRGYGNAASAYIGLSRLDEAKAITKAGLPHNSTCVFLRETWATIALAPGDMASREQEGSPIKLVAGS